MHSFVSCLMHCVFSTKERRRLITPEIQNRLYPYLGGIARENKMKTLSIGGVEDHVHALLSLPATLSIAKSVQLLKGNCSKWIHETFPNQRLNGKKATELSASLFQGSKIQFDTFNRRKNTTECILLRTN